MSPCSWGALPPHISRLHPATPPLPLNNGGHAPVWPPVLNSHRDLGSFITVIMLLNYSWAPSALFLGWCALISKVATLVCQAHAKDSKKQVSAPHYHYSLTNEILLNSKETVWLWKCGSVSVCIAASRCRPHARCTPKPLPSDDLPFQKFTKSSVLLQRSRASLRQPASLQMAA